MIMTSPGTYSVCRENSPLPFLVSMELEPSIHQATFVWSISLTTQRIDGNGSSGNSDNFWKM
ncbi:unnamed protein product [Larinioides sclopetarius]|uniref:Uncharacterized protein n=1 Tax=Larinioides sclopetarius TaxID=280406 RepID=A0AAV1YXY1_9ARAC